MADLLRRSIPFEEITGDMINAEDLSRSYPEIAEFLVDAHSNSTRRALFSRVLYPSDPLDEEQPDKRLLAPVLKEAGFEVVEIMLEVGKAIKCVSDFGDFVILPIWRPVFNLNTSRIFNISRTDDTGVLTRVDNGNIVETVNKSIYKIMADNGGKVFFLKKPVEEAINPEDSSLPGSAE